MGTGKCSDGTPIHQVGWVLKHAKICKPKRGFGSAPLVICKGHIKSRLDFMVGKGKTFCSKEGIKIPFFALKDFREAWFLTLQIIAEHEFWKSQDQWLLRVLVDIWFARQLRAVEKYAYMARNYFSFSLLNVKFVLIVLRENDFEKRSLKSALLAV